MITAIAVILILAYLVNVIYVLKKGSLALGLLFMGIVWAIVPYIGFQVIQDAAFLEANADVASLGFLDVVTKIFQTGPENWGTTLINYLMGAFFGCVMLRTNITSTIIRKTVELGGDKPGVTLVLLSIVLALISTGVYGTGAMISLGVIVLPIMLALGISKLVAVITFIFSCVAGLWLNPVLQNAYLVRFASAPGYETYTYQAYVPTGIICFAVTLICTIAGVLIMTKRDRKAVAWAAVAGSAAQSKDAPAAALITPVIPALLVMIFKVPTFFAYILCSLYALLVCGRLKSLNQMSRELTESFADGMVDTAPMMFFLYSIGFFGASVSLAQPYLGAVIAPIIPKSTLIIALFVGALAFLGLFRGPLTTGGSGIVTVAVLASAGLRIEFLYPVLMATTMIAHFCCCITQSWTAWAITYTKEDPQEYLKKSFLPLGWVIIIILVVIAWIRVG